jgi:hypothetical protein
VTMVWVGTAGWRCAAAAGAAVGFMRSGGDYMYNHRRSGGSFGGFARAAAWGAAIGGAGRYAGFRAKSVARGGWRAYRYVGRHRW